MYLGTIVSIRIIMIIAALVISRYPGYFNTMPCRQIEAMGGDAMSSYQACAADMEAHAVVAADFNGTVENIAASFHMTFGMAGWIALWLHGVGVEIYLSLTPAEHERLRRISYERQLERGFSNPGRAGLTADRLGDADPWAPPGDIAVQSTKLESLQVESSTNGASTGPQQPVRPIRWRSNTLDF